MLDTKTVALGAVAVHDRNTNHGNDSNKTVVVVVVVVVVVAAVGLWATTHASNILVCVRGRGFIH